MTSNELQSRLTSRTAVSELLAFQYHPHTSFTQYLDDIAYEELMLRSYRKCAGKSQRHDDIGQGGLMCYACRHGEYHYQRTKL